MIHLRSLAHALALPAALLLTLPCLGWANQPPVRFVLNENASGVQETINNIKNLTVVSQDANVFKAEYQAGFVQGHLQGITIASARDNAWPDNWYNYSIDPPTQADLAAVNGVLKKNFSYLVHYLKTSSDARTVNGLKRLLFRMVGIYHGATMEHPADLNFSGNWLPDANYFSQAELKTGYGTPLTFMDVYFVNASADVWDALTDWGPAPATTTTPMVKASARLGRRKSPSHMRCSAFLKRLPGDVVLAHTTWAPFLSQTMTETINVNGDMVTMNTFGPGQIESETDFGFNNKGIMFNETTNGYWYTEPKVDGLFIFWRAAMAEELSRTLDDFFHYLSVDNTGTYLNAYMLVDAKTNEVGLVDMSYKHFVFYRSFGGPFQVSVKPAAPTTDYDHQMVTPDYMVGFNHSPSVLIQTESDDTQTAMPNREVQLLKLVPGIRGVNDAKAVITHNDPAIPYDSIFSRFDLVFPDNPTPDFFGSIDAKVGTASMTRAFMALDGKISLCSDAKGFWMLFGTPHVNGTPFIWSQSPWPALPHPDVPDVVDGAFTNFHLHLR